MKGHWTGRSVKDYLFRIATDFISQLAKKMESLPLSQDGFAEKLGVTKGRVSQLLNHPGNISLAKMIEYASTLGLKVSVVAYEDDDPENKKGPIDSEIFQFCWERCGKPHDFWAFQTFTEQDEVTGNATNAIIHVNMNKPIYFPYTLNQKIGETHTATIPSHYIENIATTPIEIQEQERLESIQ